MVAHLNVGFTGHVSIQDGNGIQLYRKDIRSKEEMDQWVKTCKTSVPGWGPLISSFVPIRTDNWVDLAKDLFFPNFINCSLKINNLALKIIDSIVSLLLDVATFLPRLIALPFRIHFRSEPLKDLPIYQLLSQSPHLQTAIRHGTVQIVAHQEHVAMTGWVAAGNDIHQMRRVPQEMTKTTYDDSYDVHLKDMPMGTVKKVLRAGGWEDDTGHSSTSRSEVYPV